VFASAAASRCVGSTLAAPAAAEMARKLRRLGGELMIVFLSRGGTTGDDAYTRIAGLRRDPKPARCRVIDQKIGLRPPGDWQGVSDVR
jgi:hypothetical protein